MNMAELRPPTLGYWALLKPPDDETDGAGDAIGLAAGVIISVGRADTPSCRLEDSSGHDDPGASPS